MNNLNIYPYHLLNVNLNRDFRGTINGDIALAEEGYACVKCEGNLLVKRGIEIGHVFKLGTQYSESMDVNFSDPEGELNQVVMGCYGIGIGRILASSVAFLLLPFYSHALTSLGDYGLIQIIAAFIAFSNIIFFRFLIGDSNEI